MVAHTFSLHKHMNLMVVATVAVATFHKQPTKGSSCCISLVTLTLTLLTNLLLGREATSKE